MMTEQSNALALKLAAFWTMKNDQGEYLYSSLDFREETAAELHRLHAEHEEDQGVIAVWRGRTQRAEAQRDTLLVALKGLLNLFEQHEDHARIKSLVGDYARAAIAAVEGVKE